MKAFIFVLLLGLIFNISAKAQEILGVHSLVFAPGGTATQVVFSPSANTNGATLKTAVLTVGCGQTSVSVAAVKTDGTVAVFSLNTYSGDYRANSLTRSIYFPPGTGLSLLALGSGCEAAQITYDMLD